MKARSALGYHIAFWAIFLATGAIIGLNYAGYATPKPLFYLVWIAGMVLGIMVFVRNMQSAASALQRSAPSGQNIIAVNEGKTDIVEHRTPKERHEA